MRISFSQRTVIAFVGLLMASSVLAEDAIALKVGDAAPALHISKWLNGDPVEKLEKGKIYVLECWATWCGPCRESIPHVSEMNTKLKDKGVVFIGMNVSEPDAGKVEPFVKKMGEKMNYRVALDDNNQMAETWLKASGQEGIPCAFIVDKETKIAWIGHPMMGMEEVLNQVIAGTFDVKKFAADAAKRQDLEQRFHQAFEAKDADKMLAVLDEMVAMEPAQKTRVNVIKFNIFLTVKHDDAAAYKLAQDCLAGDWKDDPMALNEVAWTILTDANVQKRDVAVALKLATRAAEVTKNSDPAVLDTLAHAYADLGQFDKAIENQTLAVDKAAEPQMKGELQKTLDEYKKKAGAK